MKEKNSRFCCDAKSFFAFNSLILSKKTFSAVKLSTLVLRWSKFISCQWSAWNFPDVLPSSYEECANWKLAHGWIFCRTVFVSVKLSTNEANRDVDSFLTLLNWLFMNNNGYEMTNKSFEWTSMLTVSLKQWSGKSILSKVYLVKLNQSRFLMQSDDKKKRLRWCLRGFHAGLNSH